ncbi:hypothetical protein Tco_0723257 [Tanacetum coccineum]
MYVDPSPQSNNQQLCLQNILSFTQASLDLKGLCELVNVYNEDNIAKDNKIKELEDKNSWYETELNRKQIYLEECKKDYDKMKKGYDKMKKDNEQMKDHLNEMDRKKKDNLNGMDLMKKAHTNEMDLVLKRNAELEHHRRLYDKVIEELSIKASNNKETWKAIG